MSKARRLITIFTPAYADADATNAQRLTVKEIVERCPNYPAPQRVILDPAPAHELFAQHLVGADRGDLLFRWMVLTRVGQLKESNLCSWRAS